MKRRSYTMIVREGWYYLIVFALVFGGAMVQDINLLLILAGILAGPLLLSRFIAVRSLRGLTVQRKLPHSVCAGDLLVADVSVTNPRRRLGSWAVVVDESIQRETKKQGLAAKRLQHESSIEASVLFPYLAAGQTGKGVYRGRLVERGRYRLGPLRLSTRFPFGLCRYAIVEPTTTLLTVLPRLGRLTRSWEARRHEAFAGTDRRERQPGVEGDFYGVRPWQRGDSARWIHWRTTARAGEVVVRQFEQPRNRDIAVILDLWQPEKPTPEQSENVELAVSFVATFAADLCRKGGSDMFLFMADPKPHMSGGPATSALLQEIMERLALIEAQAGDPTLDLLDRAARQVEPGTETILVSTRPADLAEPARLRNLSSEPRTRAMLRNLRVIDTSDEDLGRYFRPE